MAIIKEYTNNQGIGLNYWVAKPENDVLNKKTKITMLGFLSKESRKSGYRGLVILPVGIYDGIYLTGEQVYSIVKDAHIKRLVNGELVGDKFFEDAVDDI